MRKYGILVTVVLLLAPLLAQADPQAQASQDQASQVSQSPALQDVFSYSYLQVNRLSEQSDFFNDRSAGQGLKFSYGFNGGVYLFGQWNRLNFARLAGHHPGIASCFLIAA